MVPVAGYRCEHSFPVEAGRSNFRISPRNSIHGSPYGDSSRGDSYDNALAETINGLYKAELIHRLAPWQTKESLELATRGLAHHRDRYYLMLANADMARHGDLDGRGNLSERMLRAWCHFFIELRDDQVTPMEKMLEPAPLKQRIADLILVRSEGTEHPGYCQEAVLPLHHVLTEGPVSRGEFVQMTGLEENIALKVLSRLVKDGLLVSDGPKGDVGIGFPLDALNLIFPNLYPEAATLRMED